MEVARNLKFQLVSLASSWTFDWKNRRLRMELTSSSKDRVIHKRVVSTRSNL
jgi:hypothetical protein